MRHRALDPTTSFIVQAPAGSGKTELLTQRYLKLLSVVEKAPEEIIAVTFTRKAAAEMRHRILLALQLAAKGTCPETPHQAITYELAKAAITRDQLLNWGLLENPNRLRILTIDALAATLGKQLPILAGFGGQPEITENAYPLYELAATQLLNTLPEKPPWSAALTQLLLQLNNQSDRFIGLLANLLAKREQWLGHIMECREVTTSLRPILELALQHAIEDAMQMTLDLIDPAVLSHLQTLCHAAAADHIDEAAPLIAFANTVNLDATIADMTRWHALTNLLLTQQGEWRKTVTKREGFPAKSPHKKPLLDILSQLQENSALQGALQQLKQAPPPTYTTPQWDTLSALIEILPVLAAELSLVFQENGCVDFVALNLAALRALGDSHAPTDLALYLDHQIHHLLIDEFQDTSLTQFTLIERLTAGWQPEDGRSIFLVGDPMQSIYRFRDAEVSLFLHAEQQGINNLPLTKLTLKENFRAQKNLVAWVNETFQSVFPAEDNLQTGAIAHATALPTKPAETLGVTVTWDETKDANNEAKALLERVTALQREFPNDSIAILVRARSHLTDILSTLQAKNIPFEAIALEPLTRAPVIQDLMSLTAALRHHGDRTAWFSVMRAPYFGLTLQDIHAISETKQLTLWASLKRYPEIKTLSAAGLLRCQRIVPLLNAAITQAGRLPLEQWISGLWLALGGPAAYPNADALNAVPAYFDCLATLAENNPSFDKITLLEQLEQQFTESKTDGAVRLQIMTIHKSKGLEFDHVLLPGLHHKPTHNPHAMLLWLERQSQAGTMDLLLAPIKASDQQRDPIYHYLNQLETEKQRLENARLLYVAATRAKRSLHLFGHHKAAKHSFMSLLPITPPEPKNTVITAQDSGVTESSTPPKFIRLSASWVPPGVCMYNPDPQTHTENPLTLLLEDQLPRAIGTTIHALLANPTQLFSMPTTDLLEWALHQLRQLQHWPKASLETAKEKIMLAINNILNDPRARWILDPTHSNAYCEWPITTVIDGKIQHFVIDRSFETETACWIIDYKTTIPQQQTLSDFLMQERITHQKQLQGYVQAIKPLTDKPIKTALYFPLCQGWITEVAASSPAVPI